MAGLAYVICEAPSSRVRRDWITSPILTRSVNREQRRPSDHVTANRNTSCSSKVIHSHNSTQHTLTHPLHPDQSASSNPPSYSPPGSSPPSYRNRAMNLRFKLFLRMRVAWRNPFSVAGLKLSHQPHSRTLSHTHTSSLALSHTFSLSHTLSHSLTLSHTLSHSNTLSHSLTL